MPIDPLTEYFEPVRQIMNEAQWPGASEGLSWGTAAIKVGKKLVARIREPGILVVICEMEEKDALMASQPDIYFQTDHYKGYPAVLVRLANIEHDDLYDLLERSWKLQATPQMIAEFDDR